MSVCFGVDTASSLGSPGHSSICWTLARQPSHIAGNNAPLYRESGKRPEVLLCCIGDLLLPVTLRVMSHAVGLHKSHSSNVPYADLLEPPKCGLLCTKDLGQLQNHSAAVRQRTSNRLSCPRDGVTTSVALLAISRFFFYFLCCCFHFLLLKKHALFLICGLKHGRDIAPRKKVFILAETSHLPPPTVDRRQPWHCHVLQCPLPAWPSVWNDVTLVTLITYWVLPRSQVLFCVLQVWTCYTFTTISLERAYRFLYFTDEETESVIHLRVPGQWVAQLQFEPR